jgi:hypothetical protein
MIRREPSSIRAARLCFSLRRYTFTSFFLPLQKRQRPSRSDGGCCEKGMPSSGEKLVKQLAENSGVVTVDPLEAPASRRRAHGRRERRLP